MNLTEKDILEHGTIEEIEILFEAELNEKLITEGLAEEFQAISANGITPELFNALTQSKIFPNFKMIYKTIEEFQNDITIRNTPKHPQLLNSQRNLARVFPNTIQSVKALKILVTDVQGRIGSDKDIQADKIAAFKAGEDPKNLTY